jgi:hypothetical protein
MKQAGFKVLYKLTLGSLCHEAQIRAQVWVLRDAPENRNRT